MYTKSLFFKELVEDIDLSVKPLHKCCIVQFTEKITGKKVKYQVTFLFNHALICTLDILLNANKKSDFIVKGFRCSLNSATERYVVQSMRTKNKLFIFHPQWKERFMSEVEEVPHFNYAELREVYEKLEICIRLIQNIDFEKLNNGTVAYTLHNTVGDPLSDLNRAKQEMTQLLCFEIDCLPEAWFFKTQKERKKPVVENGQLRGQLSKSEIEVTQSVGYFIKQSGG